MYHSHHDEMTQMALGTMGLFIIHPRPDRDFAFMLGEWRIDVGTARPNPNDAIRLVHSSSAGADFSKGL
jgi:manganese oxidase